MAEEKRASTSKATRRNLLTFSSAEPIEEYDLWRIFHCLSRALVVIHQGSEDGMSPRWTGREIVHFDLKPDNSRSDSSSHQLSIY